MDTRISAHYDVREFVPKEIFDQFGENSKWFVSDQLIRAAEFTHDFFERYYKELDSNIVSVTIVVNNWHIGGQFNWRGMRTVKYINEQVASGKPTATLSQHVGGSTNAFDFNVVLYFKGGKTLTVNSNDVFDIIIKHEKEFIAGGLTTLENKTMTQGWTHGDARHTGLQTLFIVEPPTK